MIVLDTNVVSQLTGAVADRDALEWLDQQRPGELALTAITVAELLNGIVKLPTGRRRDDLARRTDLVLGIVFGGRSIAFDGVSARHFAVLMERARRAGATPGTADAQIAAICHQYGATLATRNIKDFAAFRIDLVNPWS